MGGKQLLLPPKQFVSMSLTAFSLVCTNMFPCAIVFAGDRTTHSVISGALKQLGTRRRDEEPSERRRHGMAARKSHFQCSKVKGVKKAITKAYKRRRSPRLQFSVESSGRDFARENKAE